MDADNLSKEESRELYEKFRDALGKELKARHLPEIKKHAWASFLDTGEIDCYLGRLELAERGVDVSVDHLIRAYLDSYELHKLPRTPHPTRSEDAAYIGMRSETTLRERAVSALVADIAAEEPLLKEFRQNHLPDGLLRVNQIEEWLAAHGYDVYSDLGLSTKDRYSAFLDLGLSGDPLKRFEGLPSGSEVDELQFVVLFLSGQFGWLPAQTTAFVLTGMAPTLNAIRFGWAQGRVPAAYRITLVVDPTVSPEDLAEAYRAIRNHPYPARLEHFHRQSNRLDELALFMSDNKAEDPTLLRGQWNDAHPDKRMQYKREIDFQRDAQQAKAHLLYNKQRRSRRKKSAKES
jgi:hypothetical protein